MRPHGIRSFILAAAAMSLACARTTTGSGPSGPAADPRTGVPGSVVPGQRASASSKPNASRKRVDAKEEPATLVAFDKTRCTVTEQRFRDTNIGDTATCDWRTGDRAP
jgi:hypothetical protein